MALYAIYYVPLRESEMALESNAVFGINFECVCVYVRVGEQSFFDDEFITDVRLNQRRCDYYLSLGD